MSALLVDAQVREPPTPPAQGVPDSLQPPEPQQFGAPPINRAAWWWTRPAGSSSNTLTAGSTQKPMTAFQQRGPIQDRKSGWWSPVAYQAWWLGPQAWIVYMGWELRDGVWRRAHVGAIAIGTDGQRPAVESLELPSSHRTLRKREYLEKALEAATQRYWAAVDGTSLIAIQEAVEVIARKGESDHPVFAARGSLESPKCG